MHRGSNSGKDEMERRRKEGRNKGSEGEEGARGGRLEEGMEAKFH